MIGLTIGIAQVARLKSRGCGDKKKGMTSRGILFLLVIVSVAAFSQVGISQTRTWDGSTSSDWFTASNWSGNNVPDTFSEAAVINGAGGGNQPVIPASSSVSVSSVTVSGGQLTISSTSSLTSPITVSGTGILALQSGGAVIGNLNVSGGTATIGSTVTGDLSLDSGTLNFGSGATITGNYQQSGGTANAGSGTLNINGDLSISGGTFTPSSSTVVFGTSSNSTISISGGSVAFNDLSLNKSTGTNSLSIATGTSAVVNGTLTLTNGQLGGAGSLNCAGNVSVAGTFDGGSGNLQVVGPASRTISLPSPISMPNVTINAPNAVLTTVSGFNPISFASLTINSVDTVTFNAPFSMAGGTFANNTVKAVRFNSSFTQSGGTFTAGTGEVDLNGNFTLSGGTFIASSTNTNAFAAFVVSGGTFDPNNGTLIFDGTTTSSSTFSAYNVTINGSGFSAVGVTVTVNGTLRFQSGLHGNGTFNAIGDVVVDTGFGGGTGRVSFGGTAVQIYTNLGGANPAGIWTIDKSGGSIQLASDMNISSSTSALNLTNGSIVTGSFLLNAGTRPISRTAGFVDGGLRLTYTAAASRTFDVGTSGGYAPVSVNATAGTFGSTTTFTVRAIGGYLVGASSFKSLTRHWSLDPSVGGITAANIRFDYLQTDVPVTATETNFLFLRRDGTAITTFAPVSLDFINNFALLNGVTQFSDWSLGELGPSAANGSVNGRVRNALGSGISGARISITDSSGNTRYALSNPFGYFRFDDLSVGSTYVLTVSNKSHRFSASSTVVTMSDGVLDIEFVADP